MRNYRKLQSIDTFAAISVYTFVTKLYHLCMIWQITSLPNLIECILFIASPRDDNEFHKKFKCQLWPWLMAILNFWSTPKLLLWPSWSYGSLIYNHICNQCLWLLTLWVWTPLRRGALDTTLCDKVCQWLAAGRWFSPPIKLTVMK